MLSTLSADELAGRVTEDVYERAVALSHALNAHLGKPKTPRLESEFRTVVLYAQRGLDELSNDCLVAAMNSVIDVLSFTCYEPATPIARAIFDRKAGEFLTDVDLVLAAARARWNIELGLDVPIRWLAALGGTSVKTARNLASARELTTRTKASGQVATAREAARWLGTRGINVRVGVRRVA